MWHHVVWYIPGFCPQDGGHSSLQNVGTKLHGITSPWGSQFSQELHWFYRIWNFTQCFSILFPRKHWSLAEHLYFGDPWLNVSQCQQSWLGFHIFPQSLNFHSITCIVCGDAFEGRSSRSFLADNFLPPEVQSVAYIICIKLCKMSSLHECDFLYEVVCTVHDITFCCGRHHENCNTTVIHFDHFGFSLLRDSCMCCSLYIYIYINT